MSGNLIVDAAIYSTILMYLAICQIIVYVHRLKLIPHKKSRDSLFCFNLLFVILGILESTCSLCILMFIVTHYAQLPHMSVIMPKVILASTAGAFVALRLSEKQDVDKLVQCVTIKGGRCFGYIQTILLVSAMLVTCFVMVGEYTGNDCTEDCVPIWAQIAIIVTYFVAQSILLMLSVAYPANSAPIGITNLVVILGILESTCSLCVLLFIVTDYAPLPPMAVMPKAVILASTAGAFVALRLSHKEDVDKLGQCVTRALRGCVTKGGRCFAYLQTILLVSAMLVTCFVMVGEYTANDCTEDCVPIWAQIAIIVTHFVAQSILLMLSVAYPANSAPTGIINLVERTFLVTRASICIDFSAAVAYFFVHSAASLIVIIALNQTGVVFCYIGRKKSLIPRCKEAGKSEEAHDAENRKLLTYDGESLQDDPIPGQSNVFIVQYSVKQRPL